MACGHGSGLEAVITRYCRRNRSGIFSQWGDSTGLVRHGGQHARAGSRICIWIRLGGSSRHVAVQLKTVDLGPADKEPGCIDSSDGVAVAWRGLQSVRGRVVLPDCNDNAVTTTASEQVSFEPLVGTEHRQRLLRGEALVLGSSCLIHLGPPDPHDHCPTLQRRLSWVNPSSGRPGPRPLIPGDWTGHCSAHGRRSRIYAALLEANLTTSLPAPGPDADRGGVEPAKLGLELARPQQPGVVAFPEVEQPDRRGIEQVVAEQQPARAEHPDSFGQRLLACHYVMRDRALISSSGAITHRE